MEDKLGIPFRGSAGRIFDRIVQALGFERGRETHVTNVVKCRPPNNRTPTKEESRLCGSLFLDQEIEIVQPKAIICFGRTAAGYILNTESKSLGELRGKVYDFKGAAVGVTFHPAYLLYNRRNEAAIKWSMWRDITAALEEGQVKFNRKTKK